MYHINLYNTDVFFSYYFLFECSTHFCSRLAHWWLPCREVFVLLHCWSERRQCRSFDQTYHPWWPGTTRSCIDTKRTMFCCIYQQLAEELLKRLHKMIWLSAVLKILKCFLFHYHQLSSIFLNSNSLTSDKTNLNVEAIWLIKARAHEGIWKLNQRWNVFTARKFNAREQSLQKSLTEVMKRSGIVGHFENLDQLLGHSVTDCWRMYNVL